jgi:hypothetical protein
MSWTGRYVRWTFLSTREPLLFLTLAHGGADDACLQSIACSFDGTRRPFKDC